jgi:glycosidase
LTEGYIAEHVSIFPEAGYRMVFLDNHDKNSWEGNVFQNFGDGLKPAMILIGTIDGMPMLYSGQESGLDRSLNFFEKDPIVWKEHENGTIFKKLFELKHRNKALWNGDWGGKMVRIKNNQMANVIAFSRTKDKDNVIVIINFSDQTKEVIVENEYHKGKYTDLFTSKKIELIGKDKLQLTPWGYLVFLNLTVNE